MKSKSTNKITWCKDHVILLRFLSRLRFSLFILFHHRQLQPRQRARDATRLDFQVCFLFIFFYFTDYYTILTFTDSLLACLQPGTTTWVSFFLFLLISLITTIYRTHTTRIKVSWAISKFFTRARDTPFLRLEVRFFFFYIIYTILMII
jgi:hypothetical protein